MEVRSGGVKECRCEGVRCEGVKTGRMKGAGEDAKEQVPGSDIIQ